jgi:hypothetical protein
LSVSVQALPSLQALVSSGVKTQPLPPLQVSSVHDKPSLQLKLPEPIQAPLLSQASVGVHKLLSVQLAPFRVALPGLVQVPVLVLQLSKVHGLLSLQLLLVVKVQLPPTHLSTSVQALPSLQVLLSSLAKAQPVRALQLSSVHGLLSLHANAPLPIQAPLALHVSVGVHRLLSLQALPLRLLLPALLQTPVVVAQESTVHGLPSLQFLGEPTQLPELQASSSVHTLPSVQVLVLSAAKLQPLAGRQLSSVQSLLSLQLSVPLPTQAPLTLQVSVGVHKLPSLQAAPTSPAEPRLLQVPVTVSQESSVQGLPSLQLLGVPTHVPELQPSLCVQALPSVHVLLLSFT